MNLEETMKVTGHVRVLLRDIYTGVERELDFPNLVVTTGKNHIAARMKDAVPAQMSHMAVGTGVTAPAAGDTTLQTELVRVALTTAGGTVAANVVTYAATFPAGTGTGALTEAGILNAASVGTLLVRATFAVINKGAADSMTVTWTLTVN
jgi:hypothetical protein